MEVGKLHSASTRSPTQTMFIALLPPSTPNRSPLARITKSPSSTPVLFSTSTASRLVLVVTGMDSLKLGGVPPGKALLFYSYGPAASRRRSGLRNRCAISTVASDSLGAAIAHTFVTKHRAIETKNTSLCASWLRRHPPPRSSNMATAGNFLPSKNSRKAPPPVEM